MALPETEPAAFLATRLADQIEELALNTNLFVGPVRMPGGGVDTKAVFLAVGSGSVDRKFGADALRYPVVQVRVRADGEAGQEAGLTLARACLDALDNWVPGSGGYLLARALQAEPASLWLDPSGNPEWTFNVQLTWSG